MTRARHWSRPSSEERSAEASDRAVVGWLLAAMAGFLASNLGFGKRLCILRHTCGTSTDPIVLSTCLGGGRVYCRCLKNIEVAQALDADVVCKALTSVRSTVGLDSAGNELAGCSPKIKELGCLLCMIAHMGPRPPIGHCQLGTGSGPSAAQHWHRQQLLHLAQAV